MSPAVRRRARPDEDKLMVADPTTGRLETRRFGELATLLEPSDLVVVNDAATLPAALDVSVVRAGRVVAKAELRLFGAVLGDGPIQVEALLFAPGAARAPTESRADPETVAVGDRLVTGGGQEVGSVAKLTAPRGRRIVLEASSGAPILRALYEDGRAVGYAYLEEDPELWDVQTLFGARPWAAEMPSAGRPISFGLLTALRRRGVEIARLTHGAGLSSTGRAELDRSLPREETFEVGVALGRAVLATRARGGRVVAVGTTVVRALESAARAPRGLRAGRASTDFVLGPDTRPLVVDAVVTGMHEPETSHYQLLRAFAPDAILREACAKGDREGYLLHELGDSLIVLPPSRVSAHAA